MKKRFLCISVVLVIIMILMSVAALAEGDIAESETNLPEEMIEECAEHEYVDGVCMNYGSDEPDTVSVLATPVLTVHTELGTGLPELTWEAVDGAENYEIYCAPSENGEYVLISSTYDTNYTDNGAKAGTVCYYKLVAVSDSPEYSNSELSSAAYCVCRCASPVVTPFTDPETGIPRLKWEAVDGAVEYEVWRANSKSGEYHKFFTTSSNIYGNTVSEAGHTYYYYVIAIPECTEAKSAPSAIVSSTCKCTSPVVTGFNDSETGIPRLKWETVYGATEYEVWRANSENGEYHKFFTTTSNVYSNTVSEAGYKYYYYVVAIPECAEAKSAPSTIVSRICKCPCPIVVGGNNPSTGYPQLTWKAVSGADYYEIHRALSENGQYVRMFTTPNTIYTNTTAQPAVTYYYRVVALSNKTSDSVSSPSVTVERTCDCAQPIATVGNNKTTGCPILTWNKVKGADRYEIYRATSKTGTYVKMFTTPNTCYTNTYSEPGMDYFYKLVAVSDKSGYATSVFSPVVERVCDCAKPVITSGTNTKAIQPQLTWKAVAGADYYEIYRATSENGTYIKMFTTPNTRYTNTVAQLGNVYYYKIVAVSDLSEFSKSAYSDVAKVFCAYQKIYVSPSDQIANQYTGVNTTEAIQCRRIADSLEASLKRCGFAVYNGQSGTFQERAEQSDDWGADLHVPLHTNACNNSVSGTRIFTATTNGADYECAKRIFNYLAPLTPGKSDSISTVSDLYEINKTKAPTVYIESEFHDVSGTAKWIVNHTTDIAEAICKGICDFYNVQYKK